MKRQRLLPGFVAAALLPLGAMAADQHTVVNPDAIVWKPVPPAYPKGAQMAVLYGDPTKEGPFALRMKFPAGYKVAPHMHPADENVTVLSGSLHIAMGDTSDPGNGVLVKAGGAFLMPKGMHHYGWTTEETIIQGNGVGPTGITYVNEKDDPRKTN
jgi:mannose-6-phosphate isomerase-like protein (cupin superfamily)